MKNILILLTLLFSGSLNCFALIESDGVRFEAAPSTTDTHNYAFNEPVFWRLTGFNGSLTINHFAGLDPTQLEDNISLSFIPGSLGQGTYRCTLEVRRVQNQMTPDDFLELTVVVLGFNVGQQSPIDVVFTIDVSGSMGDDAVCDGEVAPAQPISKINYLKAQLWTAFTQLKQYMDVDSRNRFALVTFSSAAQIPIPVPLNTFNAVESDVRNALVGATSIQAQGATSLGAGINEAIATLNANPQGPSNRKKFILLFTNGMQNTGPMVGFNGNNITIGGSPLILDANTYIIPYAIFAPNDAYSSLLQEIATRNHDSSFDVLESSPKICDTDAPIFQNWVNAAHFIGSPKIVEIRFNKFSGTSATEEINVSENMDRLSFGVNSVDNININGLTLEKKIGGTFTDITPFSVINPPLNQASNNRNITVLFTPSLPGGAVSSGEYRVKFSSTMAGVSYKLVGIVDDRGLKQKFSSNSIISAGEPLYLSAILRQAGAPITNADAKAIIYQPIKALGKSFARKAVPGRFIKVSGVFSRPFWPGFKSDFGSKLFYSRGDDFIKKIEISHPTLPSFQDASENNNRENGEKKHVVLLHETNYLDAYQQKVVATIPLIHQGDGIYMNKFKGTQKPGLYHVRFEAQGNHPVIGSYLRFEETTPLVVFGTPDSKRSTLCLVYENPLVLLIRPVDIHGNLLGPNQVDAIKIEISAGSAARPIDYLDGRYMVQLFVPDGVDPKISIRINGRSLFNGELSKICRKRWFFQGNAGKTTPQQNLELNYQGSWLAEAKLGYRLNFSWFLQAKGGTYRFDGINTPDTHISSLGLGIGYRTWTYYFGGLYFVPEFNAAFYQQKGQDWNFGYNVGLGVQKQLSHCLDLSLNYDLHRFELSGSPQQYSSIGGGFRIKF